MRKIQIYPSIKKLHTGWKSMLTDPPEGYVFMGAEESAKEKFIEKLKKYKIIRTLYHLFLKTFKSTAILNATTKTQIIDDVDLIYSTGTLYYGEKPWVIDVIDHPYGLAGNSHDLFIKNLEKIEKALLKENCKKILCPHESAFEIMKEYFSKKVIDKTVIVRQAIKPVNFKENKKKYKENKRIQILFMGSINNPQDFYMKGGVEAIETFRELQKKYDVELIVKCKIPEYLIESILKNKGIKIIEKEIPFENVVALYTTSDILLQPSHAYVLMAFLEAM